MPRALRWLIAALVLQLVADLVLLLVDDPAQTTAATLMEVGALGVDAAVLLMLLRATELTRAFIRGAAGAGMVLDAWILLGCVTLAPSDVQGWMAIATSAGLVAASGFAWIVLGRDDVRAWIFARWLRRHDAAAMA